jgi:cysteine synthase
MTTAFSYADATDAYQMPRLIRLGPNLYGAAFTLMKMVPARYILNKALAGGQLEPGTVIVETTSGTFGLALAMHAVRLDRKLILVSDPVVDDRLYRRLIDLGATVERVPASAGAVPGGFQAARLARLRQIQASHARAFCPEQYTNPDNPAAYASVAELMLDRLGPVDCIVGPVGSGGSMCGTTRRLRQSRPGCLAVGVDTHGSVLFGHDDAKRELRGLGMSMMPANLDHRIFDQVHWCTAAAAYRATRELHQRHALFMGPTSGAAYLAARWWVRRNPDAVTVVMLPDEGHRYQDTVYNDDWLADSGHRADPAPSEPVPVGRPGDSDAAWTVYRWGRRSYDEVMADAAAGVAEGGVPAGSR